MGSFCHQAKKSGHVLSKQFPLRPPTAKTIHRSQGDTLSKVFVDLAGRNIQCHMHNVALSRITSMSGLQITNLNETKISVREKNKKKKKWKG